MDVSGYIPHLRYLWNHAIFSVWRHHPIITWLNDNFFPQSSKKISHKERLKLKAENCNKKAWCRLVTVALALLLVSGAAFADKTLRGRLKAIPQALTTAVSEESPYDTITAPSDSLIRLSGYDKPLNSRYESLFVTNLTDCEIVSLTIRIVYKDMKGRILHEQTRRVNYPVPERSTRRVQIPSWDKQFTFYYVNGRTPRTANVTPYDVSCSVERIILIRENQKE